MSKAQARQQQRLLVRPNTDAYVDFVYITGPPPPLPLSISLSLTPLQTDEIVEAQKQVIKK